MPRRKRILFTRRTHRQYNHNLVTPIYYQLGRNKDFGMRYLVDDKSHISRGDNPKWKKEKKKIERVIVGCDNFPYGIGIAYKKRK